MMRRGILLLLFLAVALGQTSSATSDCVQRYVAEVDEIVEVGDFTPFVENELRTKIGVFRRRPTVETFQGVRGAVRDELRRRPAYGREARLGRVEESFENCLEWNVWGTMMTPRRAFSGAMTASSPPSLGIREEESACADPDDDVFDFLAERWPSAASTSDFVEETDAFLKEWNPLSQSIDRLRL